MVLIYCTFIAGEFGIDGLLHWSTVSAQLGVLATGAYLLMISDEFD